MIKIICIGKIKEQYLKDAINEYLKRISKYTKLEIIELPDYNYDIKKTIEIECDNILKNIKETDYNILLDIEGNSYNSIEFAKNLDKIRNRKQNGGIIQYGSDLSNIYCQRCLHNLLQGDLGNGGDFPGRPCAGNNTGGPVVLFSRFCPVPSQAK